MNRKHFFAAVILLSLLVMGLQLAFAEELEPLQVSIDVRPNDSDNIVNINIGSHGVVPVAIYGNADVDLTALTPEDIENITLGDETGYGQVHLRGNGLPLAQVKDLDNDPYLDLVVYIDIYNLIIAEGQVDVQLRGNTHGGQPILGEDVINIVPSN